MKASVGLLAGILAGCNSSPPGPETPSPGAVPEIVVPDGQRVIALCGPSSGYSYYIRQGLTRENAGWTSDEISKGYFYVLETSPERYDLIFRDASGQTLSAVEDGAVVNKVRQGEADAAFTVIYQEGAKTVEVYTLYREENGTNRFTMLTSKGGESPIYRSGISTGTCHPFKF